MKSLFILIATLLITSGCSSSSDDLDQHELRQRNQKGEYLYRTHSEFLFTPPEPDHHPPKNYPWDKGLTGNQSKITKEFFRCKGSTLNPCRVVQKNGEINRLYDCGGYSKHSLPLRDGKEFIYPILIELLNHIQTKTNKRVVITCGHRCPEHNTYSDPSTENQYSKHMVAAEVSFYVQGMEDRPEEIVKIIHSFYKENTENQGKKDFDFIRYEKSDTNVSTQPWYNKEIFVKLFKKDEGRNFDNRHPYPYLSIQVRYDRDLNEKVIYNWVKANRNYHRW